MEDCCAVCAEPLEWVAYGACGHRDVCSTCIVRLRVVLEDKRCCICKQESDHVFVTKALGEYTKVIPDFTTLPGRAIREVRGIRQGEFWYDDYVDAYFDDEDEYKRIKAMVTLQCKVCETSDNPTPPENFVRKGYVFRNLVALRRHLYGAHKVIMCSLCLEGRKVFIRDQRLYTKGQLERHSSKGDSYVDGTEEERAGFSGHPICTFCNRRFYGENELYQHMTREHFTCHLCKRSQPDREFEYYETYDHLESHFRNEHVLCEHPECLAKKFIVFVSDGEFKIHNVKEHGGNLSRGERRAAMKIPVASHHEFSRNNRRGSFYRGGGRDQGRGDHDLNTELFSAMRESMDTAAHEEASTSTSPPAITADHFPALGRAPEVESAAAAERTPLWTQSARPGPQNLTESAFPPLAAAAAPPPPPQQQQPTSQRPMTSLFGQRGNVKVLNHAQPSPPRLQPSPSSLQDYPELPNGRVKKTGKKPAAAAAAAAATGGAGYAQLVQKPAAAATPPPPPAPKLQPSPSSLQEYPELPLARGKNPSKKPAVVSHAQAAGSHDRPASPPPPPVATPTVELTMDEIRAATKLLFEDIKKLLKGNEEQIGEFKEIQGEFKTGKIDAKSYYDRLAWLGLTVIIPELARLCPDPQKQAELQAVLQRSQVKGISRVLSPEHPPKGKGKGQVGVQNEVEVLATDGYRSLRGRFPPGRLGPPPSGGALKVLFKADSTRPSTAPSATAAAAAGPGGSWSCESCTLVNSASSVRCGACGKLQQQQQVGEVQDKQKDAANGESSGDEDQRQKEFPPLPQLAQAKPPRGAWRNAGGQKLAAATSIGSIAWNKSKR